MIAKEKALTYLDEGFSMLKAHKLFSINQEKHTKVIDSVLLKLKGDENAAEIAAAFQSLYEASLLITPKSSVDGNRIIMGDYFISIAVKLIIPINTPVLVDSLCSKMKKIGVTTGHIAVIFKRQYGVLPIQYLSLLRAEEAKKMLSKTDIPIIEIAENIGFNSLGTFYGFFKKYAKMTPKEFRNKNKTQKNCL